MVSVYSSISIMPLLAEGFCAVSERIPLTVISPLAVVPLEPLIERAEYVPATAVCADEPAYSKVPPHIFPAGIATG